MPRTWLITGSSRGLGRALAEAALAAGENVVATARNPDQLQDLVERYDETLDATLAVQIFGPVDPQMLDSMRGQTGEGVLLTAATEHLGGFTRSR